MVKINDVEVNTTSISYGRNLKDEIETAEIVVVDGRQMRYEPLSLVEIQGFKIAPEQYIIENDAVTEYRLGVYEHRITLVDLRVKLDKYIPASRSFTSRTGTTQTLRDILNVYKRELERFHYLIVSYVEGPHLDAIIPPKEYDGETYYNILADLFRSVDAIPKVFEANGTWFIFPQFYNQRRNLIGQEREALFLQQNNIDYATKIRANVRNGVFDNPNPTWLPSATGGIRPRAAGVLLTESQLRYELDSKTAQVIKVIAPTQLTYQGVNGIYDVDITRNVVTQEEYDSLPRLDLSDENLNAIRNKANCIILDLQDNKITNLFYVQDLILGFTQNVDVLENAIKYSIFRQFPLSTSIDIDPIKQRKIRVQYYRLRDSDLSVQRQSNNGMVQSTIGYTQKASVVDVGSYMNALTTLSSRMGNQEKTITLAFDNDQTPYEIGDYDSDGFVITEAKYTLRPNDIFAEYNLSLNYANTNSDYAVRYEISPFTVTGKKLMTNVIDEQYVIASDVELASNDTKMTSRGLSSLFSLLSRVARQRIEYGVYKQTNQIFPYTQAIHMPVAEEYGSSTLAFNVHFERPIIAGKRVYTEQATQFLDPILYTANIDEEYVLENFELYLSNGADITDDGSYPIIEETNDVITNALTLNEQMPIDLGLNDSLSYTFAIHGVTNNELKVGFGNGFFKYNGLWYDSTPTLTLYKSTYPYSIADKTIRDVDTPVINGNYTFNSSRRRLNVSGSESFNYWALVYQGDIVVWGNNTKEVWFRIVREIEPNYDPITLITDSYFEIIPTTVLFEPLVQSVTYIEQEVLETVTPSVLFDIAIQSVTFITEAYIIDEPTTVIMDVIIGDFTILSRSIVLNEPTTILKTETITNFTYVEDSITLVEPTTILFTPSVQNANTIQDTTLLTITPTVLFTPQIQNATVLTDSIIVNEPTTIINDNQVITETNITQEILLTSSTTILNTSTITNVVWDFDYLGTATQPFDFSYTLAVEGADAGACPSASQVDTWLNANYDVYNFSVGDIIRVQTVVVDSNGFPVASCNSHYFEVVVV